MLDDRAMNDPLPTSLVAEPPTGTAPGSTAARLQSSSLATTSIPTGLAGKTRGLRKSSGGKTVLDGIDLDVPEGTIFALLGPNGAGKTTMVQILSTLLRLDAGEGRVAGLDLRREARAIRGGIRVTG